MPAVLPLAVTARLWLADAACERAPPPAAAPATAEAAAPSTTASTAPAAPETAAAAVHHVLRTAAQPLQVWRETDADCDFGDRLYTIKQW